MPDARKAIKHTEDVLMSEEIDSKRYWFREGSVTRSGFDNVYCLPAFDEFVIGYKDRSACLSAQHKAVVISINGMFFPIVVYRGKVLGSWKKSSAKEHVMVTPELFSDAPSTQKFNGMLKRAAADVSAFFADARD